MLSLTCISEKNNYVNIKMKRIFYLITLALISSVSLAQPKLTSRAINSYPTALPLTEDDIEWQRDIYREIDISEDANAGLFCYDPADPTQEPLFSVIFKLAMERDIPVYRYSLDGNEIFNSDNILDMKDLLDDYQIPYKEVRHHVEIKDEDIPTQEVKSYYVKEGVYYDITNSAFRRRVLALCPVIVSPDEFGDGDTKYPLFWVRYIDLEPFLKGKRIIPDSRNKAAIMNITDYFTLNRYKGPIYKVNNAQGLTLSQYCDNDSLIMNEQLRIEQELKNVQKQTYNTFPVQKKPIVKEKKKRKSLNIFGLKIQRKENDSDKTNK